MTPELKAQQIYKHLRSFNAAEAAISLLWHHNVGERDYWEEVWEALIDTRGEHWQKLEFQHNRKDYINACQL